MNLGQGHILDAEIWGLYFGLKLAVTKGITCLIIEMDAAVVVHLVKNLDGLAHHPFASLINARCALMKHFDNCTLLHIDREKNSVANGLANWSYNLDLEFNRLGTDLAQLKCSLDFVEEKDLEKAKLGADVDYHKCGKDLLDPMNVNSDKKSSLQWFVTKVQDRIVLCAMRLLVVKNANKSRHSLEYLDKDETVVAHVVGGVDAFIKVPQGWPLLSSPLKLIYLKSSDQHSKGISFKFSVQGSGKCTPPHLLLVSLLRGGYLRNFIKLMAVASMPSELKIWIFWFLLNQFELI
ncbi:PREDICTED: RNA-directed DNA polymerase (reverse mRNAase)-related family [Prunus dulcis]|uniref:PREDICTED: RNA-directed DNA polymerase (Reverse mRNAase)-related family n=1 Tax=Prunus dulcis TaxID=3755 RepID=A0A5E4G302_PRUDU|nr:PREDICTED: RNA-directed DNA polymerase (reverse mRNAase)-related family [Prunus dulcis]